MIFGIITALVILKYVNNDFSPGDWHLWFKLNVFITFGWTGVEIGTDIHVPIWMNCSNFEEP